LPELSCLKQSSAWSAQARTVLSIDGVDVPTLDQCEKDYHNLNPANASLLFQDYLRFLLVIMATDGLDHGVHVQLARQFMKIIELTSHFCTAMAVPTKDEILDAWHVRHGKEVLVTAFSVAGEELCRCSVEGIVGSASALVSLTEKMQPWVEKELLHIELIGEHKDEGVISRYDFQAVRLSYGGLDIRAARARLDEWGLGCRLLPSQLAMALAGVAASAKHEIYQEYFGQLRRDLNAVARSPVHGSHYIVLLDVSSSMRNDFLRAYQEEISEFEALGLDRDILLNGLNINIVEHILDSYFVPQLLQSGVQVGNAKFSHKLVRAEIPSAEPTPFRSDATRNGGGTEIYHSLMAVAAHLTLPVLDMTGDAGIVLITDGEQTQTSIDVDSLARLFNRNFRLEVIGLRARLSGPLQKLIRGSFSVPYQIGNLKNLMTALSETLGRIQRRAIMAPENRNNIRQPVELYHPHMWYLLDDDSD
jgi:hypothetical protein